MRQTDYLRAVLVFFVLGLLIATGVLHLLSLEAALAAPEFGHLRLPAFLAVAAGLLPFGAATAVVYALLGVVDRGEAFSTRTVALLRRLRLIFTGTTGYLLAGALGFHVAFDGLHHITILLAWFAILVVVLFLVALAGLLERLFADAVELRVDSELTI